MRSPSLARCLPNLLSLVVFLVLIINYFGTFADLDFAWQISTGEQIIRQRTLRPVESFTYTIAGESIPDFEWLYELTLYGTWSALGVGGLKFLQTVLVASALAVLAWRLKQEGVGRHGVILSVALAAAVGAVAWNLRPMYCTSIGLLLLCGWLYDHCRGRRPLPWYVPLLTLLWANLHPGIIMAQGLLVGAIAWEWLNRWVQLNSPLSKPACLRLTIIGGLSFLATFVSPSPIERVLYPFRPEVAHPVQRAFAEMRPLPTLLHDMPHIVIPIYALAALVTLSMVLRFRHYRLWEIALLLGLAALANMAVRSLHDWLLMMLVLGAPHLAALLGRVGRSVRSAHGPGLVLYGQRLLLKLDRSCKRVLLAPLWHWQRGWVTAMAAGLAALTLAPRLNDRFERLSDRCPVHALDWMEAHEIHGRVFGVPDFGTYVHWRLGEQGRCYVDTRGFFFPPELLEDSMQLPSLAVDWQARLERVLRFGTEYFLLETEGPRGQLWRELQAHVGPPLYLDEHAVLLSASQLRDAVALLDVATHKVRVAKTDSTVEVR